jgi:hypothetical protein
MKYLIGSMQMKTGRKQKYIELSPSRSAFYSAANMTKSKTCRAVHIRGLGGQLPPPRENYIYDFWNAIINYSLDIWECFGSSPTYTI